MTKLYFTDALRVAGFAVSGGAGEHIELTEGEQVALCHQWVCSIPAEYDWGLHYDSSFGSAMANLVGCAVTL
jgi:hypothetical protein